jgi:hypothetical protein
MASSDKASLNQQEKRNLYHRYSYSAVNLDVLLRGRLMLHMTDA